MKRLSAIMFLTGLAVTATPGAAQKVDPGQPDTRIVYGSDPGTTNLNQEQAVRAAQMDNNNVQNSEVYRRQVEEHNRAVAAADAARRAYEQSVAANNAQRAAYDAAMIRWRADVAACNAGNVSRCGAAAPQ